MITVKWFSPMFVVISTGGGGWTVCDTYGAVYRLSQSDISCQSLGGSVYDYTQNKVRLNIKAEDIRGKTYKNKKCLKISCKS